MIRAHAVVAAVAVKIQAVVARVVEHAVQQHAHAALAGLLAQAGQIGLRAQHGVHAGIIAGIIAVIAARQKDGVQIQHGDVQRLQIIQLGDDALQVAAEEIPRVRIAVAGIKQRQRGLVPVFMQIDILARIPRRAAAAEAVGENLIHDALAQEGGGRIIPRVHGQLKGRGRRSIRFAHAAQAVARVAQVFCLPVFHHRREIVPQQARGGGRGKAQLVAVAAVGLQRDGIGLVVERNDGVDRARPALAIDAKTDDITAANRAEGGAAIQRAGVVIQLHKSTSVVQACR